MPLERPVLAGDTDLAVNVGFVVESERRARTIHALIARGREPGTRVTFLTAVAEALRRNPLGGLWSDGRMVRSTRDLARLPLSGSWPILTPGCLLDGDVLAVLDDRAAAMVPALGPYRRTY